MNLIDQDDGPSETGSENDEVNMVLHVNGTVNQPIVMKRKTNKETFTAISVSGSQIKTFTQADLQKNSQSWSDFGAINAEKWKIRRLQKSTVEFSGIHLSRCTSG